MSGEDMVRALNFVEEKYIEEAEMARLSNGKIWLRVGSMAACLCLLAFGIHSWKQHNMLADGEQEQAQVPAGGTLVMIHTQNGDSTDTRQEESRHEIHYGQGEPKAYAVSSKEIRTDGGNEDISYPFVTVLRSLEELDDYCRAQGKIFDLETEFLDASKGYDESYFVKHDLILICVEETSGAVTHQVTDVREEQGGWIITVVRHEPEEKTDDLAQWHILVEIQIGKVIAPEAAVSVRLENKEK